MSFRKAIKLSGRSWYSLSYGFQLMKIFLSTRASINRNQIKSSCLSASLKPNGIFISTPFSLRKASVNSFVVVTLFRFSNKRFFSTSLKKFTIARLLLLIFFNRFSCVSLNRYITSCPREYSFLVVTRKKEESVRMRSRVSSEKLSFKIFEPAVC